MKNLEDATSQIDQPLNLNRFQTHFQFGLEYEKNIFNNLAAAVSLDYHSDYISGSSYDFRLDIEQVTNYELNYVVLGFSLIYYYPVFQLNSDDARIFGGGSFEYIYSDIDVYYRYIEWATEYNNRIQIRKTGYDEGGRFFGGLEIPVSESIYLQIRTGYAIRNIVDLAKKVDKTEQLPFNQRIIDAKTFDLSSFFVTFGISYFF